MSDYIPALIALAVSAFTSATLLPGTSEGLLAALSVVPTAPYWLLLLVASSANVVGSCANWLLGRFAAHFRGRGWLKRGEPAVARAERLWGRWGKWSLLLSWVPVIGDPLTLVAGLLRVPFLIFLPLVTIAKTARYAIVIAVAASLV